MKKLDKETIAERDKVISLLESRFRDLEAAVEGFNTVMTEPWLAVQAAIEAYNQKLDDEWGSGLGPEIDNYNGAVDDANIWRQQAAQEIQDYMDERSEKWQESDRGQEYSAWRDEFDGEFGTCDIERPEDLSVEEPGEVAIEDLDNVVELLEQLPIELGE